MQWQVQAQVDAAAGSAAPRPGVYTRAGQIVHRVERSLPGQVQFVDNLSDQLNTAAGDALYAETLYIMLAVPGALVALGLAYLAALGTVERDRRDLALLRARGATRRDLLLVAGVRERVRSASSPACSEPAAALGRGGADHQGRRGADGRARGGHRRRVRGAGDRAARSRPAWAPPRRSGARASATAGARVQREHKPLWQRLYLDLAALALSGLIYWLTASTGFSAVVNPDSNPTLSLSVYMFFAPALLWLGATLLLVRLRGRALAWAAGPRRGRPRPHAAGFLLASAGRRGRGDQPGLLVVGLLLAFGVNLGIFTATYDQQANVDAQLTLGADVTATAPPGVDRRARPAGQDRARCPASRATHRGRPLLRLRRPRPPGHLRHRPEHDQRGHHAARLVFPRRERPADARAAAGAGRDGILVSKETISDYQLKLGDLLNLRVLDHRSGRFHVVPFHVAGIVQEFPSAPRDSFMVANLPYLQAADHAGGPNVVFVEAADPPATAPAVAQATRTDGTIVKNIDQQTRQTVSSITTVDLRGISQIEEAFTIALAAAAMALFVALT